jgi:hypothetical protein
LLDQRVAKAGWLFPQGKSHPGERRRKVVPAVKPVLTSPQADRQEGVRKNIFGSSCAKEKGQVSACPFLESMDLFKVKYGGKRGSLHEKTH